MKGFTYHNMHLVGFKISGIYNIIVSNHKLQNTPLSFIFTLIFCYANLVGCLLIKFEADYVVLILLIHFCIMLKCELWRIGRIDKNGLKEIGRAHV